ncbi:MAG: penicillin-binding protein [Hyphomonadaceae bacterium]|nr:MAG: penicillin-binding protein [Hyphomonadaceae bacterium]KAF0184728.1 MAG: penicillin-binding protein [Hyphomonadaceae bacterium]
MLSRRSALAWLGGGVAATGFGGSVYASEPRTPAFNWAQIDEYLDKARRDWNAPGLAFAIVRDGAPIYAKGFGYANVENRTPVNADTIFNVGSTTKAFTAAAIAIAVDEGKLAWDTPVREYLPSFRMGGEIGHADDYASVNLRDMMSHRTGLGRHDLLWYNNKDLTREKLLAHLPYLNTFAPIRSKYEYNNLMVMLSGHALEKVVGISWEDYVKERIFTPLSMTRSNTSCDEMMAAGNYANGHRLRNRTDQYSIPLRPEDRIGPAGAINSSINDYAKWIALQLGKGSSNGVRLFSNAQSNTMWEPSVLSGGVPSSPELSRGFYGLGWRIDTYRGMTRVAHGGNLNGFASRITLFPEKNLGFVAFVNLGASPLPGHTTLDVTDMLLGLEPANWSARGLARRYAAASNARQSGPVHVSGTATSHLLNAFVGKYNNRGYGDMIISFNDGALSASYNEMPMKLEHWHYDVFNVVNLRGEDSDLRNIKFVFATDVEGRISSFTAKMDETTAPVLFERVVG